MLLNFLKPRHAQATPEEDVERIDIQTPETKSSSTEQFLQSAKTKTFVKKWSEKKKEGKKAFTKRGIVSLLGAIFNISALKSDDDVLDACDDILMKLGDMDGLRGFLLGWKARSEGLMKAVKTFVGQE